MCHSSSSPPCYPGCSQQGWLRSIIGVDKFATSIPGGVGYELIRLLNFKFSAKISNRFTHDFTNTDKKFKNA